MPTSDPRVGFHLVLTKDPTNPVMKILLLLLILVPGTGLAYESPQDLIESGFLAYQRGDSVAAFKSWTRGSGMERQGNDAAQALALSRIRDFYGDYQGYEIVRDHQMSTRARMILLVMNFDRGITFARFQVYRQSNGNWVLNEFKFHTESVVVWPADAVFGPE